MQIKTHLCLRKLTTTDTFKDVPDPDIPVSGIR